jgi:hypothetical protein
MVLDVGILRDYTGYLGLFMDYGSGKDKLKRIFKQDTGNKKGEVTN